MRITDIQPKSQRRAAVFVDGEYFAILDIEIILQYHLRVDMEIDAGQMEEIRFSEGFRKARERALHLLAQKEYTAKQLLEKLQQTNEPEICRQVVEMMRENGLIDDLHYAIRYIEDASEYKCYGEKKIRAELKIRGVDTFTIEDAYAQVEVDPLPLLQRLIAEKYSSKLAQENGPRKVSEALLRRGFTYGQIKQALKEYGNEEPDIC